MTPTLLEQFYAEFSAKLCNSARWPAFCYIAEALLTQDRPHVIETGCLRQPDNWMGDGQSTRIWDWIARKTNGTVAVVDINPQNVIQAQLLVDANVTHVYEMDSIRMLRMGYGLEVQNKPRVCSLLYLDSYDYNDDTKYLSMLHHAGELACVYDRLPSGCLIAVDDCHSDTEGKHCLVKAFFDMQGIEPVLKSYVHIWRKP